MTGACWSWTTHPRTGPEQLADRLAAELPGVEVLHRHGKEGLGRGLPGRVRARAVARRGVRDRDGRRLLARPEPPARDDRGRRAQRPRARVALRGRRGDHQLASAAPPAEPQRLALRPPDARRQGTRPHRGLSLRTPASARDGRARDAALAGLRLQHRADLPGAAGRIQRQGDPDLLSRPRGGREQDVAADRGRGAQAGAQAAPAAHRGRRAALERRRTQPPRALALAALAAPPRHRAPGADAGRARAGPRRATPPSTALQRVREPGVELAAARA